jgi:hypothetical protein
VEALKFHTTTQSHYNNTFLFYFNNFLAFAWFFKETLYRWLGLSHTTTAPGDRLCRPHSVSRHQVGLFTPVEAATKSRIDAAESLIDM